MFTTGHFIWLGICLGIIVVLSVVSLRWHWKFKTAATLMMLVTIASELINITDSMQFVNGVDATQGMVIVATALPLHMCSLLMFVFLYLPFCKNEKRKSFFLSLMVPVALIGASIAILTATNGVAFDTSETYQYFIYHAVMIWFAIYLVRTRQADLGARAWRTNLVTLVGLAVVMIWINGALRLYDTNFFFVVRPPVEGLPFLNLNQGWYAYFAKLVLCGLVGLTLVHLPTVLRERREAKETVLQEN